MDYRIEAPPILRDFLTYTETIKGKSKKTADEYFLDLRLFLRYILQQKVLSDSNAELDEIDISSVDIDLVKRITLSDIYDYMSFLSRDRVNKNSRQNETGISAVSRARKVASLRSFFKYLTNKAKLLEDNPVKDLDSPKSKKTLPKYLSVDESVHLLSSVDGVNKERDYCILTFFLNCGLRLSELVGINVRDMRDDTLRVLGKGSKERVVYLNDACMRACADWLDVRKNLVPASEPALFISRRTRKRISPKTVQWLVKKYLLHAGLDTAQYSTHKLRHTAATLMYQNGVDVRTLQEILGHENLDTTKIYTHVDSTQIREAIRSNPLSKVKK